MEAPVTLGRIESLDASGKWTRMDGDGTFNSFLPLVLKALVYLSDRFELWQVVKP